MIIQMFKNVHDQDFKDLKLSVTARARTAKFLKERSRNPKNVFKGVDIIEIGTTFKQNLMVFKSAYIEISKLAIVKK